MEKILAYDHAIVPQETSWDCGPAAAQVVLNALGIHVSEQELIREIGTTTRGTDYVGLIEQRCLDRRVPQAGYTSVYIENDPPTGEQTARLWEHIRRSINAGYGVIMNWVAPPSNKPRGVKGSPNPHYSGGTTYHYVAAMGYDDEARAVWIADSGFWPFNYWISLEQCASLIPPKGYTWAANSPALPAARPDPAVVLRDAMRHPSGATPLTLDRYRELLPHIAKMARDCNWTTVDRLAMGFAQLGHEAGGLQYKREIHDGSNYEGRVDLGNTQPGDGRRFRGRGFIQLTGRHNYTAFSKWAHDNGLVATPTWFVDHPEQVESDENACLAVTYYWTVARPQLNDAADNRDLVRATRLINGGTNGLNDRQARYDRCLAMGESLLAIIDEGNGLLSALSPDEQREVLFLLRIMADQRFKSRSPFRRLESTYTDTAIGYAMGADGSGHGILTILGADAGNERDIALLREVASAEGDDRYPDRQGDARLARHVLNRLGLSLDDDDDDDDGDDGEVPAPPTSAQADQCALGATCRLNDSPDTCGIGGGRCALVAEPKEAD